MKLLTFLWITMMVSSFPTALYAATPWSGARLLQQCGGSDDGVGTDPACSAYVRGVLDTLAAVQPQESLIRKGFAICVPADLSVSAVVELYKSESRRFPGELAVPAGRLITGMLLKFFPCRSA